MAGFDEEDGSGSLHEINKAYEEDGSGTLHLLKVYEEDADGNLHYVFGSHPSDLTIVGDTSDCPDSSGATLNWDPDTAEQQEIWRCNSDSCDPFATGSKIDTVAAGVDTYTETGLTEGQSYTYGVRDVAQTGSTTEVITAPPCP